MATTQIEGNLSFPCHRESDGKPSLYILRYDNPYIIKITSLWSYIISINVQKEHKKIIQYLFIFVLVRNFKSYWFMAITRYCSMMIFAKEIDEKITQTLTYWHPVCWWFVNWILILVQLGNPIFKQKRWLYSVFVLVSYLKLDQVNVGEIYDNMMIYMERTDLTICIYFILILSNSETKNNSTCDIC